MLTRYHDTDEAPRKIGRVSVSLNALPPKTREYDVLHSA